MRDLVVGIGIIVVLAAAVLLFLAAPAPQPASGGNDFKVALITPGRANVPAKPSPWPRPTMPGWFVPWKKR